jgi:hypothetical protein
VPIVLKSGSLNLLEPSGPIKACEGIALPLLCVCWYLQDQGSMKYPQLVSMPSAVQDWLDEQLEARGIDAVVYTRYILSLLQRDTLDLPDDFLAISPNKVRVRNFEILLFFFNVEEMTSDFVLVIHDIDIAACLRYRVVVGLVVERGACCICFVRVLLFVTNSHINISVLHLTVYTKCRLNN